MNFIKKNINELKYAHYNPRKKLKPEDKEYQKIKKSIEEFGYVEPIIINKDNTIIGGHQRLTVLKDLGYEEVDVIQIDIDKTKEKALNIALNKITGEWDYAMLGDLLLELDSENYDLEITGFEDYEIEDILAPIRNEKEEKKDIKDIEFSEIIGEEHNYIVLYFDNEIDWLQAESLFDIKQVKCGSTRSDGKINKGMNRVGIGRVLKGREAINKILENKNEN